MCRAAERERAIGHIRKGLDRELVALLTVHRLLNLLDEGRFLRLLCRSVLGIGPVCRYLDLMQRFDALIHGAVVHVDDLLALAAIGRDDSFLQVLHRIVDGDNARELEECGLHDHIEAAAETEILRDLHGVDRVELDIILRDVALHGCRQALAELRIAPDRIQQERAALLQAGQQVVVIDVGLLRAADEVRLVDEVRARDRRLAEAQMAHRDTAGLLGVIGEVSLRVHRGLVANDLDRALVGADRTIGAHAPELAGRRALSREVNVRVRRREARVREVIDDADGEAVLRGIFLQLIKHGEDLVRRRVLAAEAIAATDDDRLAVGTVESSAYIEVQRLALGTRLLRTVKHGDLLHGFRQLLQEVLHGERTIEMDIQQADLLALGVQVIHNLLRRLADGAHRDNHALGVFCTVVVEQVMLTARDLREVRHGLLDELWNRIVVFVDSLALLEVDIRVLRRTANDRMIRIQCATAERLDRIPVEQLAEVIIIDELDFLDLMRRAETIEEVDERHAALDGHEMRDGGEVHDLLHAGLGQHRAPRLAGSHDILMVTEDIQARCSQRTCGDVEHARQQLASNLIQVRDHQQETLRCRVRRRQRAGLQRTMYGTSGTALGLHLDDADLLAEQVLLAVCGELIYMLRHRRRRRDRVDGSHIGERIGHIGGSRIAVHGLHLFAHYFLLPSCLN